MTFTLEFFEAVQNARVNSLWARRGQAEVTRNLVGGLEANPINLSTDPVRLGDEHLLRVLAIGLYDA